MKGLDSMDKNKTSQTSLCMGIPGDFSESVCSSEELRWGPRGSLSDRLPGVANASGPWTTPGVPSSGPSPGPTYPQRLTPAGERSRSASQTQKKMILLFIYVYSWFSKLSVEW